MENVLIGVELLKLDVRTKYGSMYDKDSVLKDIEKTNELVNEEGVSTWQGELNYPDVSIRNDAGEVIGIDIKRFSSIDPENVSHIITNVRYDEETNSIIGDVKFCGPKGEEVVRLVNEEGMSIRLGARAITPPHCVKDFINENGEQTSLKKGDDIHIVTFDAILENLNDGKE